MILRKSLLGLAAVITTSLPSVALASTNQASGHVNRSGSPIVVKVQAGDTLWGISSERHVSVQKLEGWNHLNDNSTLQIGAKIVIGWTSSSVLASPTLSGRSENVSSSNSSGVLGEEVVSYAKQFLGAPYEWGGESSSGFDCSGLVRFTYGHFGVSVDRSSYDQFNEGVSVSRSDLVPGDLVFFSSYGSGPSHVGIYIGGDQFINAEERGVVVDSLDSGYWSSCYYGARRVL